MIREYTHPATIKYLDVPEIIHEKRMRAATLVGFNLDKKGVRVIIFKWSLAALCKDIITPEGARKGPKIKGDTNPAHNHRHDQSILSILIECGYVSPIPPAGGRWSWIGQKDCDKRPKNI